MNEIKVVNTNLFNDAVGKTATQSSNYVRPNGQVLGASLAVDGDNSSFSHTSSNDPSPWFMVDLESDLELSHVLIANRACTTQNADSCLCRLSDATIDLMDEQDNVIVQQSLGNTCAKHYIQIYFPKCAVPSPDSPTSSPSMYPTYNPTV